VQHCRVLTSWRTCYLLTPAPNHCGVACSCTVDGESCAIAASANDAHSRAEPGSNSRNSSTQQGHLMCDGLQVGQAAGLFKRSEECVRCYVRVSWSHCLGM
jgi:hypothetical protein